MVVETDRDGLSPAELVALVLAQRAEIAELRDQVAALAGGSDPGGGSKEPGAERG